MDQISLTELRRFYFGPTLAESILYGYDCLQKFFGWNNSSKKTIVEQENSTSLQRIESKQALEENIVNPQIKTEQEDLNDRLESTVNESYGKELVVASMSNDPRNTHRRRSNVSDITTEVIKDSPKQTVESSVGDKFCKSFKRSTKPEIASETHKTKKLSNDICKSSSIIVERLSNNKNNQTISNQTSTEQKFGESSIHTAKNDILPIKSSREVKRVINGQHKKSDIMVKGSDEVRSSGLVKLEVPTTSLKSEKRASDSSTSEFISFDSSGEKKPSSKELRDGPLSEDELILLNVAKNCCKNGHKDNDKETTLNAIETTLQRPVSSTASDSKNGPPSPFPQRRRHSSSSRPHSSPRVAKGISATPHQSRNRPRLTATRWVITRVNEFDDGAKTYEILPDAAKLLTAVESLGQAPLEVLRRMQKLQKSQPVPELTMTEVIFATLPGGHTISYKSDAAKSR